MFVCTSLTFFFFCVTIVLCARRSDVPEACGVNGTCLCTDASIGFWVDCSSRSLTDVPLNIPHNVSLLKLEQNYINKISPGSFYNLTRLITLNLSENSLESLPEAVFNNNIALRNLDLSYNDLEEIPEDVFPVTQHMNGTIMMNNNKLNVFPHNMFASKLPVSLMTLDLSGNCIGVFTIEPFAGISSIGRLKLSRNNLTELPDDLFRQVQLTFIVDLSDNKLEAIPTNLFKSNVGHHSFYMLMLHRNSLTYVPRSAFKGARDLQILFLFGNKINMLADGAFAGTILEFLYLFENNLTAITGDPFRNKNVAEIHMYGNRIERMSGESLNGLTMTAKIYISCEFLQQLPTDSNHTDIECVSPASLPGISTHSDFVVNSLFTGGFNCTSNVTGRADTCIPCLVGTYADRITAGCKPCPAGGFYQDEIGKTASTPGGMSCKECNVGTYVKNGHGTSIRDCEVCPEGTNQSLHAGFRACFCKEGYARTDRYGPCSICLDEGLDCSKDFKLLAGGYFWYWKFPTANISRYRRFVENLKNDNGNISQFTNYTDDTPKTFRCPRKESCPNGNGDVEGQCAEGYTGWLCSKCLQGYYSVLNTCIKCPNKETLIIEVVSFISICILICFLFSWQLKRDARRDRLSRSFLDVVISRVKILLGFYQVVGEIFASVHDISWKGPLVIIGAFISSLEVNILRIFVRPRCMSERLVINPKIEFIIGVSCPIVIIVIPLCMYQARKLFFKCKSFYYHATLTCQPQLKNLRTRLVTCVIVLLFLFYPPICSVIFELYPRACKTFSLDKEKIYNVTRLRSDYDFNCDDLSLYQTCAYIFTGVYVVMFPAVLLYMLRRYVPRPSKSSNRPEQVNSSSDDDENQGDELTPLVVNDLKDKSPPVPLWLNFLCENYKQKYWFWEIIELCRKVTQTLLITLYGWEDRLTVLLTTCISVLFLLLHARYRPMKESYEQRLQMLSLTVIFINVLVAANDEPKDEYEDSISVILILLNILVLVIIVGEVLMTIVLHVKHSELFERFVTLLRRFTLKLQQKR